jgi:putative SOS response-associated peptidase YedK
MKILLTTESDPNSFIGKIHNTKTRKVVIIPNEYEKDFMNPDLKPDDVIDLCKVFNGGAEKFEAYTVSKAVHSVKEDSDNPDIYSR